jgi:hypothetical protein
MSRALLARIARQIKKSQFPNAPEATATAVLKASAANLSYQAETALNSVSVPGCSGGCALRTSGIWNSLVIGAKVASDDLKRDTLCVARNVVLAAIRFCA